jgi:hypothetical protein
MTPSSPRVRRWPPDIETKAGRAEYARRILNRINTTTNPAHALEMALEAIADRHTADRLYLRNAAHLAGVRAGLEAAAAWLDGDDGFDPVIPLARHMNLGAITVGERAKIEGITDAVLAGAAAEIRAIDPTTVGAKP